MKYFTATLSVFMLTSTLFSQLTASDSLTVSQCKARAGYVINDIGTGIPRVCPNGMRLLGDISGGTIESAICCVFEQPTHFLLKGK